jgi:hypothetical protein
MADEAAVVWIDTNGKFYIQSCRTPEVAEKWAKHTNECGLPVTILTREDLLKGGE